MDFLQHIIGGNTVQDYLIFGGIVLAILVLSRPIARVLELLIFSIFKKWFKKQDRELFDVLLASPFRVLVILVSVVLASSVLSFPPYLNFEVLGISFQSVLHSLYELFIVISITWILLRLADFITRTLYAKANETETKSDDQIVLFVRDLLKFVIIIFSVIFILGNIFHFNVTSIIAGAGLAGLAVAMAAKETLENLLGSFVIFWEKPFTIGDFVEVEGVMGTIEKVGFRSTRIRTIEKTFVTVPNRKMVDSNLDNMTLRTFRRVRTTVGLTYDTNIDQIQSIVADIQQYLDDHQDTNQDGIVGFHEFGDSALQVLVQYYIHDLEWATYIRIKEQINFEIMRIVVKHGSDFAFPTQTVHIEQKK